MQNDEKMMKNDKKYFHGPQCVALRISKVYVYIYIYMYMYMGYVFWYAHIDCFCTPTE